MALLFALALALCGPLAAEAPVADASADPQFIPYQILKKADTWQLVLVKEQARISDVVKLAGKLIHENAAVPSYRIKIFDSRFAEEDYSKNAPTATGQELERLGQAYEAHLLLVYYRNVSGTEELRVLRRSTGEMQIRSIPQ